MKELREKRHGGGLPLPIARKFRILSSKITRKLKAPSFDGVERGEECGSPLLVVREFKTMSSKL